MLDSGLYTYGELQKAHAASVAAQEELDDTHAKSATEKFQMIADASSSILRSLFGKSKAAAIAAVIIETASAVIKSFNNGGGFPWGLIPAAAMAAAGAAQIIKIKNTNVGFAEGTPGLDFMSFGAARNVTVHGDEAILPRGKGHVLAGEIAQAMPGGGSETAMHLRALRGSMDALPYTLVRALRSARVMAMA
jgi:predicted phage tail protein